MQSTALAGAAAMLPAEMRAQAAPPPNPSGPQETWSAEWASAVLSLDERDHRWAKVRALMAREGVDVIVCFPCTSSHDRGAADSRYLTQLGENADETNVAFPIEGEVTAWLSRGGVWPTSNWLTRILPTPRGTGGATISTWLREHPQYQSSKIAIAALDSTPLARVRAIEGEAPWRSVEILKNAFPKAQFISASPILGQARYQKSEEEVSFLRKGTHIAELTAESLHQYAREGVRERHVYAQMMFTSADAGGTFTPMFGWVSGPLGRTYHRIEQPTLRTLKRGDVIECEIEGRWGGYVAQVDRTAIIGPAPQDLKDGMQLVFESFQRMVEKMRPGATMREILEAGKIRGMNGRAHVEPILHGRGLGDDGPLLAGRFDETVLDIQAASNCTYILKPGLNLDGVADYCRWGDTVVVGSQGAQRLGTSPQELFVRS
jgi:Xaa-Pro aminopeptidase